MKLVFPILIASLLLANSADAQWYGTADFLMMDRSDNSDTVFQRRAERTITTETLTETTTVSTGVTTTTTTTPVTTVETDTLTVVDDGNFNAEHLNYSLS